MPFIEGVRALLRRQKWWETAIFACGVAALVTFVSVSLLGADSAPYTVRTNEPLAHVDTRQFADSLSQLVNAPIERGGQVAVLDRTFIYRVKDERIVEVWILDQDQQTVDRFLAD